MSAKKKKLDISGVSKNLAGSIKKNLNENTSALRKLQDLRVGISISESDDLFELGLSETHLRDAMVEFARYLIVQGAHLVYGGDIRHNGYTFSLSELSYQYRNKEQISKNNLTSYLSFPIHLNLTKSHLSDFKKHRVNTILMDAPKGVDPQKYVAPDDFPNKVIWLNSLTQMREKMNLDTKARIFLGGRINGYLGKYPGILEEASLALTSSKPTYLVGGFGGATKLIIDVINGKSSTSFKKILKADKEQQKFITQYNRKYHSKKVDYDLLYKNLTKSGLTKFSKNNGLSLEENERLFYSTHIPEIIYYILKGLNSVK